MLDIQASEATATRRRVYFHLVGTDGITPATGESGGQPQISTNGATWTSTGIGTLTAIGNGRYYADLTTGAIATAGDRIETRYQSASTAECPGDSFRVVSHDPIAVAEAVWALVNGIESGVTPRQALMGILAAACHESTGLEVGHPQYLSRDGTKVRVQGDLDSAGNRSNVTYDNT